ncbi:MAG: pentapeptide repeat-containing protein, partial [Sandaracinaceae bacterium]
MDVVAATVRPQRAGVVVDQGELHFVAHVASPVVPRSRGIASRTRVGVVVGRRRARVAPGGRRAVLRRVVLRRAVLRRAVLRRAVLRRAVLRRAVLRRAVLRRAVLRRAVLRRAVL